MSRKIFRVYFGESHGNTIVDVEEIDVLEASDKAVKFLQTKGYTLKFDRITKVELISEPITDLQECKDEK